MRKLIICAFVFLLTIPAWAVHPQTEDQKAIYALGAEIGKNIYILNLSTEEYEFVKQGMTDAAAGKKLEAEPEAYRQNINSLLKTRKQAAAQKQKEAAKSYLENAAKGKNVQKTASGLIYQQIKAGTGAQPKASDIVKFHYTGTLIDGKQFDSSVKRGKPVDLPLDMIIPCWKEGIGKMKVGGKAKLICPSDIAYGDKGLPPIVPGSATLIFEVELLDVKASAAPMHVTPPASAPKPKAKQ